MCFCTIFSISLPGRGRREIGRQLVMLFRLPDLGIGTRFARDHAFGKIPYSIEVLTVVMEHNSMELCSMTTVSVHIPDVRLTEIRDATTTDEQMVTLAWYIKNGWPEDRRNVPEEIREYFDMGDTLGIEEGVLMKGERMIIPHKLGADMKERLHSAHLGYESMMRRARTQYIGLEWLGKLSKQPITAQAVRKISQRTVKKHSSNMTT